MSYNQESHKLFDRLYNEFYAMVFQMCLGYSAANKETAEDLTQETFINIWKSLSSFENRSSYKTWIYRITVNTCLMHVRSNKSLSTDTLDVGVHKIETDASQMDPTYTELYNAIGKLEEVDRLIVIMVLEELDYNIIAEVMGISLNNLRVKIHRIKSRIGKILNNQENG